MKIQLTFILLLCGLAGRTQPLIQPSRIVYKNAGYPAITISFKAANEDVRDALKAALKAGKGSYKTKKGVIIGKKWRQADISEGMLNNWWTIKSTGRRSREVVTVQMSLQRADSIFMTDPADTIDYAKAVSYLSTLPLKVELYRKNAELTALRKQLAKVANELAALRKKDRRRKRDYDRKSRELDRLAEQIHALEYANPETSP
ncbi:MAG: hypothetical protein DI535_04890 [Citrobacter freundii]|nr:MAG: hypothetical protein DI535_04890 [Citrobacter freundii]